MKPRRLKDKCYNCERTISGILFDICNNSMCNNTLCLKCTKQYNCDKCKNSYCHNCKDIFMFECLNCEKRYCRLCKTNITNY